MGNIRRTYKSGKPGSPVHYSFKGKLLGDFKSSRILKLKLTYPLVSDTLLVILSLWKLTIFFIQWAPVLGDSG